MRALKTHETLSKYFERDNLRAAVTKHAKDELILNIDYLDAEAYLPEYLKNKTHFSLDEINCDVKEK